VARSSLYFVYKSVLHASNTLERKPINRLAEGVINMSSVASSPTPQLQLIAIDKHDAGSHGSCKVHSPVNLPATQRYKYRMIALASVHAYIAFHIISWHVFGIQIWGKTAMMGVPSLAMSSPFLSVK
jgi:hypothetical protein